MGKYSQYQRDQKYNQRERQTTIHPIWRGIGFLLMVLVPAISYVAGLLLLEENAERSWFSIPPEYIARTFSDPLIYVKVGLTIVIAILIFILITLFAFLLNRLFGPSRYGPLDAPPVRRREVRRR
jgi:hypothetical protein